MGQAFLDQFDGDLVACFELLVGNDQAVFPAELPACNEFHNPLGKRGRRVERLP
jgi:hypothetical protein